jgi:hypothetical protein
MKNHLALIEQPLGGLIDWLAGDKTGFLPLITIKFLNRKKPSHLG